MLEEKITLDKLVRWAISGLLILAVYFVTNSTVSYTHLTLPTTPYV